MSQKNTFHGIKEMQPALEEMLKDVDRRIYTYFLTNDVSDDELLIFEALITRTVDLFVRFAVLKKEMKKRAETEKSKQTDGKSSEQINKDVNYILGGLDKSLEAYIDKMEFNEDEILVLKALLSELIDDTVAHSLIKSRLMKPKSCTVRK